MTGLAIKTFWRKVGLRIYRSSEVRIYEADIADSKFTRAAGPACAYESCVYVDDAGPRTMLQLIPGGDGANPAKGARYGFIATPLGGTNVSGTASYSVIFEEEMAYDEAWK